LESLQSGFGSQKPLETIRLEMVDERRWMLAQEKSSLEVLLDEEEYVQSL
jgi:hypothetical protein